jgi:hypothetical protein
MQITHASTAKRYGAAAHRDGGIAFISLLEGTEGTAGNYHLMVVSADQYYAPRHRHNFDQVRIMLEGDFSFDKGRVQSEGMWAYFPEGTYYTQRAEKKSTTLLLQSGGPHSAGYMSNRQMRETGDAMQAHGPGKFAQGVYTWHDAKGKKHNQDGYEAIWERVNGKAIRYVKPAYAEPQFWRPDDARWQPTAQEGVSMRLFGPFTEKELRLAHVRVAAGATCRLSGAACETLVYVASGEGALRAECTEAHAHAEPKHAAMSSTAVTETLRPLSAFSLARGHGRSAGNAARPAEEATVIAKTEMTLIVFGLMALDN